LCLQVAANKQVMEENKGAEEDKPVGRAVEELYTWVRLAFV